MPQATPLLRTYDEACELEVHRYEVYSADFERVRRSVFKIIGMLIETEDTVALGKAASLRALLFSWLTDPVDFSLEAKDRFTAVMPRAERVRALFGADVAHASALTLEGLSELAQSPNPLREKLVEIILSHLSTGEALSIYCPRTSRCLFEQLLSNARVSDDAPINYAHTAHQYARLPFVDALIKIGPLRSQGWGGCPDALVTAPRQKSLKNLVWRGSRDEDGFGFSPLDGWRRRSESEDGSENEDGSAPGGLSVRWNHYQIGALENADNDSENIFELDELTHLGGRRDLTGDTLRSCVVLWFAGARATLLPPEAKVIVVDSAFDAVVSTVRAKDCVDIDGAVAVFPEIDEVELGRYSSAGTEVSRSWKSALKELYERNDMLLLNSLRDEGVDLKSLDKLIPNWFSSGKGVIQAPQSRVHFEALMRVLGYENKSVAARNGRKVAFWRAAWHEVAESRGKAIQSGQLASDIVNDQIVSLLEQNVDVVEEALQRGTTRIDLTERTGLRGHLNVFEINGAEIGLMAPDTELRRVIPAERAAQWRQ